MKVTAIGVSNWPCRFEFKKQKRQFQSSGGALYGADAACSEYTQQATSAHAHPI